MSAPSALASSPSRLRVPPARACALSPHVRAPCLRTCVRLVSARACSLSPHSLVPRLLVSSASLCTQHPSIKIRILNLSPKWDATPPPPHPLRLIPCPTYPKGHMCSLRRLITCCSEGGGNVWPEAASDTAQTGDLSGEDPNQRPKSGCMTSMPFILFPAEPSDRCLQAKAEPAAVCLLFAVGVVCKSGVRDRASDQHVARNRAAFR